MPIGEGWFIDLHTGEYIEIAEHLSAVRADPSRYRVEPEEVRHGDRERALKLVLSRGFVRVRADKHRVVAEFDAERPTALPLIEGFLRDKGFVNARPVCLHDHRLGCSLRCTAGQFLNSRGCQQHWEEWDMNTGGEKWAER